jgi:hypothetical protein
MKYLLVAVNKGWVDGYYFDKAAAEGVYAHFQEAYPNEGWILTEVLAGNKPLPNKTFHTYARDAE